MLGRGTDVKQRQLVVAPHFLEQRNTDTERLARFYSVLGRDGDGVRLGISAETPGDGVGNELVKIRVSEIIGVAKRGVKRTVALVAVRPRDRLSGVALDRASEQRLGRPGQGGVLVE